MSTVVMEIVAGVSLVVWIFLAFGHGGFWRTSQRLPDAGVPDQWPSLVAIVPARDEAEVLPATLPTLIGQDYPGSFRVIVVDDDSADGTGEVATRLGASVVRAAGPPPGWAGKVAAMAAGVAAAGPADYLLFADADIAYPPEAASALIRSAVGADRDLVSQMARLRTRTGWERLIVPAFVYFFAQLYPFSRVNGPGRTAAAAGGCMVVRRIALERAGGLAQIRGALIDDVALGRLLKRRGRIWLGLSTDIISVRPYPRLADLWRMVARSAYTQLRYSPLLLVGTVLGLLLTYIWPPTAAIAGVSLGDPVLATVGWVGWALMTATYLPMLRFYRAPIWTAPLLPAVAGLYLAMTVDSARRHWSGAGAAWKGRAGQP
jgi:hopene-associated glycosyltransferase HpnB